jgi:hypothetical protein
MLDSLVRVSRRVDEKHFVRVSPSHDRVTRQNLHLCLFPCEEESLTYTLWEATTHTTASHRFLFSNFRYYFTLFSKFFSSFPHGTCSLSVSHPYLALDGIYHPLELQSQTTRLVESGLTSYHHRRERGCHPPRRVIPDNFIDNNN